MKNEIIKLASMFSLLFSSGTLMAVDVHVDNDSSQTLTVYVDEGRGWTKEGTVRAGGHFDVLGVVRGDFVGVGKAPLFGGRINPVKRMTVGRSGGHLDIDDADLGIRPGPGPGPVAGRSVKIKNLSSRSIKVYTDASGRMSPKQTVGPNDIEIFNTANGDSWAVDDLSDSSVSLIKRTVIGRFDPAPTITITDSDLGVRPGPIIPANRDVTVINSSSNTVFVFSRASSRGSWQSEGSIRAGSRQDFRRIPVGENWGVSDTSSSRNIAKDITVNLFSNQIRVSDSDFGGGPAPAPAGQIVTIQNNSSRSINAFTMSGSRTTHEGRINAGDSRQFTRAPLGEQWGVADSVDGTRSPSIVKDLTVNRFSNRIRVSDSDFRGGPGPGPATVTITVRNQKKLSSLTVHKANLFGGRGAQIGNSIAKNSSRNFTLVPGTKVFFCRSGSTKNMEAFIVPNRDATANVFIEN